MKTFALFFSPRPPRPLLSINIQQAMILCTYTIYTYMCAYPPAPPPSIYLRYIVYAANVVVMCVYVLVYRICYTRVSAGLWSNKIRQ